RRDRRRLRPRETGAARIGEVAEREQVDAVTVLTNLAINLEAALQLRLVVHAERPGERPFQRRRRLALGGFGRASGARRQRACRRDANALRNPHAPPPPHVLLRAGTGPDAPIGSPSRSTAPVMDAGSGFGVSMNPKSGRMITKWMKYQAVRTRAA